MDRTTRFIDLFEGSLDQETEKELFTEMAIDSELRTDFKSYVAMNESINKNIDTFAPSADAKIRIFEKAGFKVPAAAEGFAITKTARKSFWNSKFFISLLTGLTTVILTVIFMLNFVQNDIGSDVSSVQGATILFEENDSNQYQSQSDATTIKQTTIKTEPTGKNIAPAIHNPNDENRKEAPEAIANSKQYEKNINLINTSSYSGPTPGRIVSENGLNVPAIIDDRYSLFDHWGDSPDGLWGFILELGGSQNWHLPEATINPGKFDRFNNTGLTLLYCFTEDFQAGLDIKQETFFTEYTGTEESGNKYIYTQQPNLTTFSLLTRYNLFTYMNFSAIAQLGLGLNKAGYVAKPFFGLKYQAYDNLAFIIGGEYSRFWFTHQNKWFNSSKLALNYTISYNF